jgi:NAD(P)-dependent dehydrogenase (short-subunit alcohol dehydrogenase family)
LWVGETSAPLTQRTTINNQQLATSDQRPYHASMSDTKIALITGAAKGIGFETARQLGKLRFTILLAARDEKQGTAAVKKLAAESIPAHYVKLDTTSPADRDAVYRFIAERFGKLDVLINNAAVILDRGIKPTEVSEDILRRTFEVNFFAVVELTKKLLSLLKKSPAGRIVNLSSNLGSLTLHSDPGSDIYEAKMLAYDTSKTALNAYTVHLAHELKETPIKVNAAHPGWIKTDMGGADAPMEVDYGAKTSVHLATLPADGPTGGYFHLDQPIAW